MSALAAHDEGDDDAYHQEQRQRHNGHCTVWVIPGSRNTAGCMLDERMKQRV